jgi:hypothetical protein
LDFKLPVYKGFWAMVSGIPGALDFGAILLKAAVSLGFLRFRTLFGTPIFSQIFRTFRRD